MEAAATVPGDEAHSSFPQRDRPIVRLTNHRTIDDLSEMPNSRRSIRRKDITELSRAAWSRVWPDPMPQDWKVYMVRKTVIQQVFGRQVCAVTLRDRKTILIGRHTKRYSFETLVHELAHLRTIDEDIDHGPLWKHEFKAVARAAFGVELRKDI
jgi:hypothetical protein